MYFVYKDYMARSKAYRKYQITINNPVEHGFTHERIKGIISNLPYCDYWCISDEIGENNTYHTHLYIAFNNPVEWDRIHTCFYGAHIENARGSHLENRDYILKQGKWADDPKSETSVDGTFEESGELPPEESKRESQSQEILEMINKGCTINEIINKYPSQINHIKNIEAVRQMYLKEKYKNEFRDLAVSYIWGKTGVGKTRSILELHGYENVYRVTNYAHPFDGYNNEPVILFDEFRSDLPIKDMLKYLDGYPLMLPCRFNDKVACYTRVYVVSNIPFEQQYPNIQKDEPETYQAFKRRFNDIREMLGDSDLPF